MSTVRLTMAQALVRYLCNQFTVIDGEKVPLFPGRLRASSGTATSPASRRRSRRCKDELPTWRGQNEQSMALAAIGFAKAKRRRQIMVATSLDRAGRHQHGDGGRRAPIPTACRSCSSPATPSPTAGPIRCCSRSSTSAIPPST